MQLASTLFGIVILQIKPQMEKLLNLPRDSLAKEIQLTEDLMRMFINYQIPSDLLTYRGNIIIILLLYHYYISLIIILLYYYLLHAENVY
jgi:hypothetical protein